jgi:hypothetical protein
MNIRTCHEKVFQMQAHLFVLSGITNFRISPEARTARMLHMTIVTQGNLPTDLSTSQITKMALAGASYAHLQRLQ